MKDYYNAKDVQQITGASKSLAYEIIKKLQYKFAKKYPESIMIQGKIPRWFFEETMMNKKGGETDEKTKIKVINIFKLIILAACLGLIIYDLYMILIYPIVNKVLVNWTMFGFLTFALAVIISLNIIEQIKSVSTLQNDTL